MEGAEHTVEHTVDHVDAISKIGDLKGITVNGNVTVGAGTTYREVASSADVRAATPSNAAQLLVPDRAALLREIDHKQHRLFQKLEHRAMAIKTRIDATAERLINRMGQMLSTQLWHVAYAEKLLQQLDPKTVLRRGYSLVRDQKGGVVRGLAKSVKKGDKLIIELDRAIMKVGVEDVSTKER